MQRNGFIIATGFSGNSTQLLSLARYQVETQLFPTTLFWVGGLSLGTAQPKSIVELNHNTTSVAKVDDIDGFWISPISTPKLGLSAVAHYPGGYVNIPTASACFLSFCFNEHD